MVCEIALKCGTFSPKSLTCTIMNGGPRNELDHAYCGILRKYEKARILVEA